MAHKKVDAQKRSAASKLRIVATERGPYLVFGRPPLAAQFILPNEHAESWYYQEGRHYSTEETPTALCRCGQSRHKPYCDGAHLRADWDPWLTAPDEPLLQRAERTRGDGLSLTDNPSYCVFARFCYPGGNAWRLTERAADPEARHLAIREASMCPSARLTAWNEATGRPYEFQFDPSIGLLEDPAMHCSGGLWVRGGIPVEREAGGRYEVRNRVVLCRCGHSANKPYCDGAHATARWQDDLEGIPEGETLPEHVY